MVYSVLEEPIFQKLGKREKGKRKKQVCLYYLDLNMMIRSKSEIDPLIFLI